MEMCGLAPSRVLASLNYSAGGWEAATVRVMPTGKVQVVTGTAPHGQGHETSWSMIVGRPARGRARTTSRSFTPTRQSRRTASTPTVRGHLPVGGVAVALATDKVIDKAREIAAHQLEAAEEDLELLRRCIQREGLARPGDGRSAPSRSRRSPPTTCPTASSRTWRPRSTTTRRTSRSPSAPTSPSSRSTPRPADVHAAMLRRRRRLRQPGQPAHRRGPGPRRHRPGRRAGAVGGGRLRRRTATCSPAR